MIELIAACAKNGVIGANNKLLWRIPKDFAFFKATTMGTPVIMGRKTWESIGRALPGRLNIVITRSRTYEAKGALRVGSLNEALEAAQASGAARICVIGGEQIYRQALPLADRIWITLLDKSFEGDARFPTIPAAHFRKMRFRTLEPTEERPYRVDFLRYDRR